MPDAVGGSVMGFIPLFIGRHANPLIFVAYCDGTGPLWDTFLLVRQSGFGKLRPIVADNAVYGNQARRHASYHGFDVAIQKKVTNP
jgi:hypothetical protein